MLASAAASAYSATEDGYDLWLRYRPLPAAQAAQLEPLARTIVAPSQPSPTVLAAVTELPRGLSGWLGRTPPLSRRIDTGAVVLATPAMLGARAEWFNDLGKDGYRVRRTELQGRKVTAIAANGETVARLLEGKLHGAAPTGMAGVANIGSERNWSGSHFEQANWYAFGRLAWNPEGRADAIAREWIGQTFSRDARVLDGVTDMMLGSREAVLSYMTPLGLTHLMGSDHHHGPEPWADGGANPAWSPMYYHRADKQGIGFDRTSQGSGAANQYQPELARLYGDPRTTPDNLLLWFHRLPWDYVMPSGRTLWAELAHRYDAGVAAVAGMRTRWEALKPHIDPQRHADTGQRLKVQHDDDIWWRNASIAYFQSINGLPMPAGTQAPAQPLEYYPSIRVSYPSGKD